MARIEQRLEIAAHRVAQIRELLRAASRPRLHRARAVVEQPVEHRGKKYDV